MSWRIPVDKSQMAGQANSLPAEAGLTPHPALPPLPAGDCMMQGPIMGGSTAVLPGYVAFPSTFHAPLQVTTTGARPFAPTVHGEPAPMPYLQPAGGLQVLEQGQYSHPPINIIYLHFHNSIRAELASLTELAKDLELSQGPELERALQSLKNRYQFMEQIYRYHSSVEDEVVYPALDSKVKNVTLAYSVEHESEERLFDQLTQLLAMGLSQAGTDRAQTVRHLLEKIEQIHTTVKKHLAKEEEQLFPLLRTHFSHAEQAQLVAEFLCSIPLAAVDQVLAWLKPNVPAGEQQQLLEQLCLAIQDQLLGQLLAVWLRPSKQPPCASDTPTAAYGSGSSTAAASAEQSAAATNQTAEAEQQVPSELQSPILQLAHIHSAIRSALEAFVEDTRRLQASSQGNHMAILVEQYRFLRAVCTFHSRSENEIMLPVAQQLSEAHKEIAMSCRACEQQHIAEAADFDALGQLLADVRSCTRRGGKEASVLAAELCKAAEAVRSAFASHMALEEAHVFPVLAEHCSVEQQRLMVWNTIRAMPLRLLERMLPWVASHVSEEQCSQMLETMKLAGASSCEPEVSNVLVQLLVQWAERGRSSMDHSNNPKPQSKDGPSRAMSIDGDSPKSRVPKRLRLSDLGPDVPAADEDAAAAATNRAAGGSSNAGTTGAVNPIDHIFQFHKALKREVKRLEKDAQMLSDHVESGGLPDSLLHQLEGRFQFLKGIYIAHSEAEDRIVFPALEKKEVLRNVSHSYSLDHQKEQEMFTQVDVILSMVRKSKDDLVELPPLTSRLRVTCAAVRANLEMHVRAEETELWPLFNEHFTVDEQEEIVGSIIGNTGAEVLQTMITWVAKENDAEEQAAMMDAFRSATRNTRFDKWLSSIIHTGNCTGEDVEAPGENCTSGEDSDVQLAMGLKEVAGYLVEASGTTAESAEFRPGWEDIFLINQQQLESAVRKVSNDQTLEPKRKAYIIQNIMASRYIVAQQQRLGARAQPSSSMASTPTSASTSHTMASMLHADCRQGCGSDHTLLHSSSMGPPPARPAAQAAPVPCSYADGGTGCPHYRRKCSLVAPCCQRVYTCRLCHDEENDHKMDRYQVTEMVCRQCGLKQPVGSTCVGCSTSMARYYCAICHLFDDEPGRDIYHCPACNVCRRGKGLGIDFFHCMKCNSCMSLSLFEKHKCREQSLEGNCAVCHEYLFDSPTPIKELPCSHFMHSSCFEAYTRYNYTCPICSKSMGDMRVYFQMLDALVASEALPVEYASRTQKILCNDCSCKGEAPYHFVYHSCSHCGSYNTRVL